MSGFTADWLRLREPFDRAARRMAAGAMDLPARLARCRERSHDNAFAVIDLGCGLGANLRELAPGLGGEQRWRLIDHDPALLAAVSKALAEWALRHDYDFTLDNGAVDFPAIDIAGPGFHAEVVRHRVDLARDFGTIDFSETALVTASALLDLVSASWLQALVRKAQAARAALLFGLNVDGQTTWDPIDRDDERVHGLFSQHQGRDKGFGPALGSDAPGIAVQQMACAGYQTLQVATDWLIDGAQAPDMQLAMIEGMATAALEQDPGAQGTVLAWKARRSAGIATSRLRVGHVDIVATPA
jgi:hypothetical protein